MGYSELEASTQDGNPVELYEFRQGSNFWRYTSAAHEVVKATAVFSPEYVKRGNITQTGDVKKKGISLVFPRSNELAGSFLGFAPEGITTVTVYRGHFDDVDVEWVSYWKGRVLLAKAAENEITLECESVFSSLKRPGLRARYELSCRHTVYSTGCTLSMSSFLTSGLVLGVDGTQITVAEAAGLSDGYLTGGILQSETGDLRSIVSHVGSSITVSRTFNENIGNQTVQLHPGCDKLKATCISKFDNLLNFGGFPYIPSRNPFVGSIA